MKTDGFFKMLCDLDAKRNSLDHDSTATGSVPDVIANFNKLYAQAENMEHQASTAGSRSDVTECTSIITAISNAAALTRVSTDSGNVVNDASSIGVQSTDTTPIATIKSTAARMKRQRLRRPRIKLYKAMTKYLLVRTDRIRIIDIRVSVHSAYYYINNFIEMVSESLFVRSSN
jgi:hypothetical protein